MHIPLYFYFFFDFLVSLSTHLPVSHSHVLVLALHVPYTNDNRFKRIPQRSVFSGAFKIFASWEDRTVHFVGDQAEHKCFSFTEFRDLEITVDWSSEFLLTQPWKNSTPHDYTPPVSTNCHQNNKQRTQIASGKNMHTKILFPLKIQWRPFALVSCLPSVVYAMLSTAACLWVG